MARCSTKGCKQGATKRLVTIDQDNNSKGRPIVIRVRNKKYTNHRKALQLRQLMLLKNITSINEIILQTEDNLKYMFMLNGINFRYILSK